MKKLIYITIFTLSLLASSLHAQVIISEVMYDPANTDSGHEWVEIYNNSSGSVAIDSNWRFYDISNHTLNLIQGTSTLSSNNFAVIADNAAIFLSDHPDFNGNVFDSVVNINNSSATIALRSDNGTVDSDSLIFDSGWGGSGNNHSLEKINLAGNNSRENWQESYQVGGTPGALSSQATPPTDPDPQDYQGLVINELLPNPIGDDATGEFIELWNGSNHPIDLKGVSLADKSNTKFVFADTNVIEAGAYLSLPQSVTDIVLNNDTDAVSLSAPDQSQIDHTEYSASKEGLAWARFSTGWQYTSQATSGSANVLPENHPPVAQYTASTLNAEPKKSILFDARLSNDPDGDELSYFWDFGDGQTSDRKSISHKYDDEGDYLILLRVRDSNGLSSEQTFHLTIANKQSAESKASVTTSLATPVATSTTESLTRSESIIISEFLPDPIGSDKAEWIELYNSGETSVDLSGWKLDDAEGGSKPFIFPVGTKIESQQYQVWSKLASKLALNNGIDSVRLLWPDNEVADSVDYSKSQEGQSYAKDLDSEEWSWTKSPTPGAPTPQVLGLAKDLSAEIAIATTTAFSQDTAGTIEGLVVIPPGVWSRQKLYLLIEEEEPLTEVYFYQADFPVLEAGDRIQVVNFVASDGTLGPKVKISSTADLIKIDRVDLPWPGPTDIADIDETKLGQLVTIQGTVERLSTKSLAIINEEQNKITVSSPSEWNWPTAKPAKGLGIMARGVVIRSGTNFQLKVATMEDIRLAQVVTSSSPAEKTVSTSTTMANVSASSTFDLNQLWYLLGFGVLLAGWWLSTKLRQRKSILS